MTYELSNGVVRCGACDALIPRGMPVYRVTLMKLPRCSQCASRLGIALPTVITESKPSEKRSENLIDFQRFDRGKVAADVRQKIQHRMLGERE